jgi:uncharacterized protein YbjT (DUF2867 family)
MYTILGATGNVGGKIAEILLAGGEKVRVVARTAERLAPLKARGATVHAGDIRDTVFLTNVFRGSEAVFTLIPPNYAVQNFGAYQDEIGESIAKALHDAGVVYAVNLSSVGADLAAGTGPIAGLHRMEQRLNDIPALNVMHLRPGYFMENTLMSLPLVRSQGILGSALRGDLKMPMIATKDIAQFAAEHLVKRDFVGSMVKYLLGERHLSYNEIAGVFGKRIGKQGLRYVQFSYTDAEKGLLSAGLSPDVCRLFIEMQKAFNDGLIGPYLVRTRENTTPTSIEEFADVFAHGYEASRAA